MNSIISNTISTANNFVQKQLNKLLHNSKFFNNLNQWRTQSFQPYFITGFQKKEHGGLYIDILMTIDLPWEETKHYEYSKLYYSTNIGDKFTENQVICFRVEKQKVQQHIRISLSESIKNTKHVNFRIDPFPYGKLGKYLVSKIAIIYTDDNNIDLSRRAELLSKKQWVREQVVKCEQINCEKITHLPESVVLEITTHCNLTCSHCATHGTPEAHQIHNEIPEISLKLLEDLSIEVFPWLTSVGIVGRGEPLLISDKTWDKFIDCVKTNYLFLTIVTNGVLIKKRITRDILPLIHSITVSIDGLTQETFGANRSNAKISKILNNIEYFHNLRRELNLPKRPKLYISWTMKKNNIHELLDFLEVVKKYEPDLLFTRHLMIYHEEDRDQSLLSSPEISNFYLEKVYKRLKELDINYECPPLSSGILEKTEQLPLDQKSTSKIQLNDPEIIQSALAIKADPCMYMYRTADIHIDGRINVCPRNNSIFVGNLHESSFQEIWHGSKYSQLRGSLNTNNQLEQCHYCWYRESKYHSQRFQIDKTGQQSYSLLDLVKYSREAWDFTESGDNSNNC